MTAEENIKPDYDKVLIDIIDYVYDAEIDSAEAFKTAKWDLLDSMACLLYAQKLSSCAKLLGPVVEGASVTKGARVPGTSFVLDPIKAAFDIGTCIRWLDYNDTWLAQEWGHPSDNLGGILAVCDYMGDISLKTVLTAMIKAHEIQGVLALNHAFNKVGLDHVLLVKVATTAVVSKLLGNTKEQALSALSHAWLDGQALRTYRHAPNTGPRKSWAAGDATARGVQLAFMSQKDTVGYPSVLTANMWGFQDVLFKGQEISLTRPLGSYVMENVLFKVSYPAEFHGQTAVECAINLHPQIKEKLDQIEKVEITTQESAMRIINKAGPLHNYADRDHSLQYMIAVAMIHGDLKSSYYQDDFSQDDRIDDLRSRMTVKEDRVFSHDYLDEEKRAIPNSIQVFFQDGSSTEKETVYYPLGHRLRREEAEPKLKEKYLKAVKGAFEGSKLEAVSRYWDMSESEFEKIGVDGFIKSFL